MRRVCVGDDVEMSGCKRGGEREGPERDGWAEPKGGCTGRWVGEGWGVCIGESA
jgi:hypothetical protein